MTARISLGLRGGPHRSPGLRGGAGEGGGGNRSGLGSLCRVSSPPDAAGRAPKSREWKSGGKGGRGRAGGAGLVGDAEGGGAGLRSEGSFFLSSQVSPEMGLKRRGPGAQFFSAQRGIWGRGGRSPLGCSSASLLPLLLTFPPSHSFPPTFLSPTPSLRGGRGCHYCLQL